MEEFAFFYLYYILPIMQDYEREGLSPSERKNLLNDLEIPKGVINSGADAFIPLLGLRTDIFKSNKHTVNSPQLPKTKLLKTNKNNKP